MTDTKFIESMFMIRFAHFGMFTSNNVYVISLFSRLLSMGELPRRPEYSKLFMQLSCTNMQRAIGSGHLFGSAHN